MLQVFAAVILALFVSASEATVCKTDSDCAANQCCYIRPQFMVVSKRQSILPLQPATHDDTGVCENYRVEHEHCGPLETANGHCGCRTGLSCQFVPAETVTTAQPATGIIIKRHSTSRNNPRSIYMPGPGSYQCETI